MTERIVRSVGWWRLFSLALALGVIWLVGSSSARDFSER